MKFIELVEDQPIFQDQHFSVYTKKLDHGIASYGFRVVEHDHKGELQVEKLQELNIPAGPIYGKLKKENLFNYLMEGLWMGSSLWDQTKRADRYDFR